MLNVCRFMLQLTLFIHLLSGCGYRVDLPPRFDGEKHKFYAFQNLTPYPGLRLRFISIWQATQGEGCELVSGKLKLESSLYWPEQVNIEQHLMRVEVIVRDFENNSKKLKDEEIVTIKSGKVLKEERAFDSAVQRLAQRMYTQCMMNYKK